VRRTAGYRINPVLQETLIFDFSKGQKTTQPGRRELFFKCQECKQTYREQKRIGNRPPIPEVQRQGLNVWYAAYNHHLEAGIISGSMN
jgi:hypothetical protein